MATTTAELVVKVEAELATAKGEIERLNKEVANLTPNAKNANNAFNSTNSAISITQNAALKATAAFFSLRTAMAAIRISDDYGQMASRLQMVTSSTEEYAMVQQRLMEISDRTYKPLAQQQELFIRSASSMKELGYNIAETVDFIDSISSSLTINSASADRAQLAIAALNRSMTSGKVAAQEWEMVLNVIPTVVSDIVLYLRETGKDANATEQSVKNMAKEGKISMELFAAAAMFAKDKNAELAENMPTTLGDAITKLSNHLSAYLADINNSIEGTEKLVAAVNFVIEHLDEFAKVVAALAAGALARYSVVLVQNTLNTIKAGAAKRALVVQELALARAQVASTQAALAEAAGQAQAAAAAKAHQAALVQLATAQKAVSAGFLGLGLPNLAMTVATAAASILLFKDNTNEMRESVVDLNISLTEAIDKFTKLDTAAKRNAAIADTKKEVNNLHKEFEQLAVSIGKYGNLGEAIFDKSSVTDIASYMKTLQQDLYSASTNALNGQAVNWDNLSNAIQNSTVITDKYRQQLLATVRSLQEKDEQIQKGIGLAEKQEEVNKNLTAQDQQRAAAQREFISSANALDDEIKKLITTVDSSVKSGRTMTDVIATLETNINNLKNTAAATPEKIQELTNALDKLKNKQLELNNIENQKYLKDLKKQTETAGLSQFDKQRYDVDNNKTLTDEQRKEAKALIAKGEAQDKSRKAAEKAKSTTDSLVKSNLSYVEGLEKQSATLNLGKIETLEYELAQKKLTGTLLQRAQASLDALRAAQQLANAKTNSTMQVELLRLTGNDYQADLLELQNKFKETTEQLKQEGNTAGLAIAKNLFDAGKAKAQVDAVRAEIEKAFSNQNLQEQTIQTQVTAKQISQVEAQKRLTELHKQTAAIIKGYIPQLEKAAQLPNAMGEQAKQYLVELNNQLLILETTTNQLENAFRNGLQDGIQSSIDGLIKGSMDLRDAALNLVNSIASSILNVAVQNVAEQATSGLMGAFGSLGSFFGMGSTETDQASPQALAITTASQEGALAMQLGIEQGALMASQTLSSAFANLGAMGSLGGDGGIFGNITQQAQQAVQAISTVTSTKTAADSTIAASATAAAATTQATNTAAASSATAAWTPAATAASVASFGTAAMIGLTALMAVMTAFKAFATGGHVTGAGTATSDSIPAMLSNGEFVTRASVVKQHGMLAFMHDLNRRGWAAVKDQAPRVKHSTGGLAGIPAPRAPAPVSAGIDTVENTNNNSTTLENSQNFYLVDDPKKIGDSIANNEHTQESILIFLEQNQQRVKSLLTV